MHRPRQTILRLQRLANDDQAGADRQDDKTDGQRHLDGRNAPPVAAKTPEPSREAGALNGGAFGMMGQLTSTGVVRMALVAAALSEALAPLTEMVLAMTAKPLPDGGVTVAPLTVTWLHGA